MSFRRCTLPLAAAIAAFSLTPTANAGPPPPPPTEGVEGGGRPTSTGVRPPPPAGAPPSAGTPRDPLIDQRTPTEDLTKSWGYASGSETRPNYVRPETQEQLQVNPIGYYQGVTLEGENLPPFAPEALGGAAVMTWTGFEGEKGSMGSRVFLQLSAPVDHHLVAQPELVTVRLPNTSVNVRNNMRQLDTSYFKTPVTRVDITRDGADTIVRIVLRRSASPEVGLREGANGYKLLVVQFPINSDLEAVEAPAPPAPQS